MLRFLRDNWAIALTLTSAIGFGVLFVQALRLAHGSPRGAALLLVGDNFLSAVVFMVTAYGPLMLFALLQWATIGALTGTDVMFGWSRRSSVLALLLISGALALVAPLYQLALGLASVAVLLVSQIMNVYMVPILGRSSAWLRAKLLGILARMGITFGNKRSQWKTARGDRASERGMISRRSLIRFGFASMLALPLLYALFSNSAWLPLERLAIVGGSPDKEGVYVVRSVDGWVTTMRADDGGFETFRDSEIENRVYCSRYETSVDSSWVALLGQAPYPEESTCYR